MNTIPQYKDLFKRKGFISFNIRDFDEKLFKRYVKVRDKLIRQANKKQIFNLKETITDIDKNTIQYRLDYRLD